MISRIAKQCFRTPFLTHPRLQLGLRAGLALLDTNYEQRAMSLAHSIKGDELGLKKLPVNTQILTLCTAINFSKKKNSEQKNRNSLILSAIVETLGRLPDREQYELFQPIISHIKFKSIIFSNRAQYRKNVEAYCLEIIDKLPSLREYYRNYQLPSQAQMPQKAFEVVMNMEFILMQKTEAEQEESLLAITSLLNPHFKTLNHSAMTCFFVESVIHNYNLPFKFLEFLYEDADLEYLRMNSRFFFLEFVEHQLVQSRASPMLIIFPSSRKNAIFDVVVEQDDLMDRINMFVLELRLGKKSLYKFFPYFFSRQFHIMEKIMNDKRMYGMKAITIYNKISDVYPIGVRLVKQIMQGKDIKIDNHNCKAIEEFLLNILRNFQPHYIYSIEEKANNQMNQSAISLMGNLIKKVLNYNPAFIIHTTALFNSYLDYNGVLTKAASYSLTNLIPTFNFSLAHNKTNVCKLINFLYVNRISISAPPEIRENVIANFRDMVSLPDDVEVWKCLFQCLALDDLNSQDIPAFFHKFSLPYIECNIGLKEKLFLKEPSLHEEYILRIANLLEEDYFQKNSREAASISSFINRNFIYSVKSVVKEGIMEILELLGKIPAVAPEVHMYLYSNLSSFLMYIQSGRRFFLQRGKVFQNDRLYINVLKIATRNYKALSKVEDKNRLNILKILMVKFWKNLSNENIAKLLIIFGDPISCGDKLKKKIRSVNFVKSDLADLDLNGLSFFKLQNKSLMEIFKKEAYESTPMESISFKRLNNTEPELMRSLFLNKELYEEALEEREFVRELLIPEPMTNDLKIKSIYVCLRLVGKIRKYRDYSLGAVNERENRIDISEEIRYIQEHNLIKQDDLNEFKLDNIEVRGHYEMVEGWAYYELSENLLEIEDYSTFGDSVDDYERVLMAVCGNVGLIRNLVKKETFYSEIIFTAIQSNLNANPQGSLIEISSKTESKEIYTLCSNNSNYKLHMIYAFLLEGMKYKVWQVDEQNTREEIQALISSQFPQPHSNEADENEID